MTSVIQEIVPPETARAVAAMRELRPHWSDTGAFVARIDEVQRPAGHRLVGAFDEAEPRGDAVAVAGFRLVENLAWGRILHVDDLSTRASGRRQGWAGRLLEWVAPLRPPGTVSSPVRAIFA